MVAVEYYHIRIRHLHIETHARLILAGLLHTTHIFILGDEYRLSILAHRYKTLIKDNQTDKDGNLVYLYANDATEQYSYIEAAKAKGYSVLLMDGELDTPAISMLEQKFEKSRFTRVDADIADLGDVGRDLLHVGITL